MRIEDPQKYHAMAEAMRAMADAQSNPEHADRFRQVAIDYDSMGASAERALESKRKAVARDANAWTRPVLQRRRTQ